LVQCETELNNAEKDHEQDGRHHREFHDGGASATNVADAL
jgi:hypothetical protein